MWVFETGEVEEAHEFHVRAYADNRLSMADPAQEFRFRIARRAEDAFYFDDYESTMAAGFSVDPLGHVLVARLSAGSYERTAGTVTERFGPGDVFLLADPGEGWSCRMDAPELQMIGLDLGLVHRVAGVDRVRLLGYRPASPQLNRRWQRVLDFVAADSVAPEEAADVVDGAGVADHSLVSAGLGQLLAATFLSVFPTDVPVEPTVLDRRDAHSRTLRRAIAFIEAHPQQDITVAEIARAASVTPRAVQLAFRRHLGTTPTAYLKLVRLHQAHRDLQAADPARGDRVVTVATRWGFASMSRFAADYRAVFGHSPSHTLRSSVGLGGSR